MFKIAICDDEQFFLDIERQFADEYLTEKNIEHEISCFMSGVTFLERLRQHADYDLVLLDVEMPVDDGVDVARAAINICPGIRVAFVSAYANYATLGYHVQAIRFIIKNSELKSYLHECIEYVLSKIEYSKETVQIEFTVGSRKMHVKDILYLDAEKNYVHFILNTHNDSTIYKVRGSLKSVTEQLTDYGFVSVSKQRSVNIRHIVSVTKYKATIDNGDIIGISRYRYHVVEEAFLLYKERKL